MPNLFTDFMAELKSVCSTAVSLPSPPAGSMNLLTTVQGTKRSFVEQLREPSARLSLPMLIFDFGDFEEITNLSCNEIGDMRAPGTIIYVAQWGGANGNQDGAYKGIQRIKAAIDVAGAPFTNFYPMEEGKVYSNVDAPINAELLADSQAQIVAAALTYQPGFLVSLV